MSSNISLASSTGSRVDSAAKHIIVARVCTDFYTQFLPNTDKLLTEKDQYKTRRDEICLGIGRPFNSRMGFSHADNKAYVPVISNASVLKSPNSNVADFYVDLYDKRTAQEAVEFAKYPAHMRAQNYYPSELFFAGIALTEGFAHHHSGDTALSTMIGGMKTIQNGRFPVYANDQVMWYFEFEADAGVFQENGERVPRDGTQYDYIANLGQVEDASNLDKMMLRKRNNQLRENAIPSRFVYPKPYLPGIEGQGASPMDKRRVFGKAMGYAAPYDLVDIKICQQSL